MNTSFLQLFKGLFYHLLVKFFHNQSFRYFYLNKFFRNSIFIQYCFETFRKTWFHKMHTREIAGNRYDWKSHIDSSTKHLTNCLTNKEIQFYNSASLFIIWHKEIWRFYFALIRWVLKANQRFCSHNSIITNIYLWLVECNKILVDIRSFQDFLSIMLFLDDVL